MEVSRSVILARCALTCASIWLVMAVNSQNPPNVAINGARLSMLLQFDNSVVTVYSVFPSVDVVARSASPLQPLATTREVRHLFVDFDDGGEEGTLI